MSAGTFKPKEFLEKLGKDELAAPLRLTGLVKPGEGSGELLFVAGTRCGHWTSVPIDIIDNVEVHGSVSCDDHSHHRVTLTFKAPQSLEGIAYAALLSTVAATRQAPAKRVVHKPKDGGSVLRNGCGCSEYEIDAAGTVWVLTDVVDFEDGSCICTYQHG